MVFLLNDLKMKNLYKAFAVLLLSLTVVSCINMGDDDFYGGGGYYNDGQVSFDGLTIPLTYADFYKKTNVQGGEIWALILSEEFISYGTTYTDAYLYLEIFRPAGAPLDGMYDMLHPVKFINYAAYYENAVLFDGNPNSYDFYIPNNSFVDGTLNVQFYNNDVHYFEVRLRTFDGKILNAYFEGILQY